MASAGVLQALANSAGDVFGSVSVGTGAACITFPAGTNVSLSSGAVVTEAAAFVACPLSQVASPSPATWSPLAWVVMPSGTQYLLAVAVEVGSGRLVALASPMGTQSQSTTVASAGLLW